MIGLRPAARDSPETLTVGGLRGCLVLRLMAGRGPVGGRGIPLRERARAIPTPRGLFHFVRAYTCESRRLMLNGGSVR